MKAFTLAFNDTFASTTESVDISADSIDDAIEIGMDYASQHGVQLSSIRGSDEEVTITTTCLRDRFRIHECRFLLVHEAELIEESISALTLDMAVDLIEMMYPNVIPVALMTHDMRYVINPVATRDVKPDSSWRWIHQ